MIELPQGGSLLAMQIETPRSADLKYEIKQHSWAAAVSRQSSRVLCTARCDQLALDLNTTDIGFRFILSDNFCRSLYNISPLYLVRLS